MRAVSCAIDLLSNIVRVAPDAKAKIGVSTGRTFCGVVGSKTRREYTVLGSMVNLSARLMQAANWGCILVDAETYVVLWFHMCLLAVGAGVNTNIVRCRNATTTWE